MLVILCVSTQTATSPRDSLNRFIVSRISKRQMAAERRFCAFSLENYRLYPLEINYLFTRILDIRVFVHISSNDQF